MQNFEWGFVKSVTGNGVVFEGFSFVGENFGVQVLRPCPNNILRPTFVGWKRFNQLTPIPGDNIGSERHLSTVEVVHSQIRSAESRSTNQLMPPVGSWLNIPSVMGDRFSERSLYHSAIMKFMWKYKNKLRDEQREYTARKELCDLDCD